MAFDSIGGVIDAFKNLKVLIIGDSMIDTYSYGRVDRISPEAPVPVVLIDRSESRLGGAANVAMNIASLGAHIFLCSVVGVDVAADEFCDLLQQNEISSDFIVKSAERKTTVKHRVVSGGQQMIRMDAEDDHSLSSDEALRLLVHVQSLITEVDVVILQDYDKGVLSEKVIHEVCQVARERNLPIVVDPKFRNFHAYKNVTLFKPNRREFETAVGSGPDLKEELLAYQKNAGHQMVLLTLSGDGMIMSGDTGLIHVKGKKRQVADVSGAGDTVIAVAALCTALGLKSKIIAELANLGGGIVCEYQGVVPLNFNQLKLEAAKNPQLTDSLLAF